MRTQHMMQKFIIKSRMKMLRVKKFRTISNITCPKSIKTSEMMMIMVRDGMGWFTRWEIQSKLSLLFTMHKINSKHSRVIPVAVPLSLEN